MKIAATRILVPLLALLLLSTSCELNNPTRAPSIVEEPVEEITTPIPTTAVRSRTPTLVPDTETLTPFSPTATPTLVPDTETITPLPPTDTATETPTFFLLETPPACTHTNSISVPILAGGCIQVNRSSNITLRSTDGRSHSCTFTGARNRTITIPQGQTTSAPFRLTGTGEYTLRCDNSPISVKIK